MSSQDQVSLWVSPCLPVCLPISLRGLRLRRPYARMSVRPPPHEGRQIAPLTRSIHLPTDCVCLCVSVCGRCRRRPLRASRTSWPSAGASMSTRYVHGADVDGRKPPFPFTYSAPRSARLTSHIWHAVHIPASLPLSLPRGAGAQQPFPRPRWVQGRGRRHAQVLDGGGDAAAGGTGQGHAAGK